MQKEKEVRISGLRPEMLLTATQALRPELQYTYQALRPDEMLLTVLRAYALSTVYTSGLTA